MVDYVDTAHEQPLSGFSSRRSMGVLTLTTPLAVHNAPLNSVHTVGRFDCKWRKRLAGLSAQVKSRDDVTAAVKKRRTRRKWKAKTLL